MRKISYILISGCITLSIIGCDETFDTSNTSEGILSLSENGLTILQSYNVGEKYNADLWIQHGGLELNNSTVTFTVDKSLLDSLNTADGTSYQILPEDCYQMTNTTVNVSAGDRLAKGTIVYDPTKIHALCGYCLLYTSTDCYVGVVLRVFSVILVLVSSVTIFFIKC